MVHYLALLDPAAHPAAAIEREAALLPRFDGFVTTSRFARRGLLDHGVAPETVVVVPPGLPARFRAPYRPRPSGTPTGRPGDDGPLLLTVSSVLPGKGLFELVEVLEALADRPWRWEGIGDDTLDPAFARRFAERLARSPVAGRLRWRGPCDPRVLPARYRAADIFVLPSRFETLSMATREAMAGGCPVVAYRVGGVPENLPDGGTGILVAPGDTAAFRHALDALRAAPARRRRMGRAAHAAARAFPDWAAAARLFEAFLDELAPDP
jgi:glycosyltransferase involved in cell wall biosynthesis